LRVVIQPFPYYYHRVTTRPLVLLSNDDGYASRGIRAMRDALAETFDVVIVAPETEQSATSHALSLHRPLRLRAHDGGIFSLDGTPADCVYVALNAKERALPRRPDVVVSGLNHGLNLGQDVFYSGTVAAAREGALRGVPALAASAHTRADIEAACVMARKIAERLVGGPPILLNLNVPRKWNGKLKAANLGIRHYEDLVDFRKDPRGREYLWIGGSEVTHREEPGCDTHAYDEGFAPLTPLVLDLTSAAGAPLARDIAGS
jgi:5'-nucleotidase